MSWFFTTEEAIPLEGGKGRFDHFGTSGKLLFVSALGNNTVEVIGISSRTLEHTITGVPNPQGVVYAPEVNKLFVASSQGKLYIYEGSKFERLSSIYLAQAASSRGIFNPFADSGKENSPQGREASRLVRELHSKNSCALSAPPGMKRSS